MDTQKVKHLLEVIGKQLLESADKISPTIPPQPQQLQKIHQLLLIAMTAIQTPIDKHSLPLPRLLYDANSVHMSVSSNKDEELECEELNGEEDEGEEDEGGENKDEELEGEEDECEELNGEEDEGEEDEGGEDEGEEDEGGKDEGEEDEGGEDKGEEDEKKLIEFNTRPVFPMPTKHFTIIKRIMQHCVEIPCVDVNKVEPYIKHRMTHLLNRINEVYKITRITYNPDVDGWNITFIFKWSPYDDAEPHNYMNGWLRIGHLNFTRNRLIY